MIKANNPFFSNLANMATVAKPNKLWFYLICFNNQIMYRITYFGKLNLSWEYKISLIFTIFFLSYEN